MADFELVAGFQPTGDQPAAIERLSEGVLGGRKHQVLLGATGTGKSLAWSEPVFVGRRDRDGAVRWSLEPIGALVDGLLIEGSVHTDERGTELMIPGRDSVLVQTVDSANHRAVTRSVTAVTRHQAPPRMWRVTTRDGRCVAVTGDHSFVRLGPGARLEIVPTTALRTGDAFPIPRRLACPEPAMTRVDAAPAVLGAGLRVYGPEVLGHALEYRDRGLLAHGGGLSLEYVGAEAVQVMERFGRAAIGASRSLALPASLDLSPSWLRFVGLFVAEGHVGDTFATITPGPAALDRTIGMLDEAGIPWAPRGAGELMLRGRAVAELMRSLCGSRAGEKHLPPFWSNLDDLRLGQLLAGYFEGDGWVEARGAAVVAATKSGRLANEISYALLRFGIIATLKRQWKRAVGTSHTGAFYWLVRVQGEDDLAAFERSIGFLGPRKRRQLATVLEYAQGGNVDAIPFAVGRVISAARRALGVSQREVAAASGIGRAAVSLLEHDRRRLRRRTGRRITRTLRSMVEEQGRPGDRAAVEAIEALDRLLACRWSTVASVEEIPPPSQHVYDLSVDGAETFLAGFGGLIVHNTFTAAQVIARANRPTLVLAHNKTLAAQLYSEFREFFPNNAVEYFVSYYDYYQPEAYLPRSDTYIEKDSTRNDEIDKLRHAATRALFERRDAIIVASVSCIYGLGAPVDYGATVIRLRKGGRYRRDGVLRQLVDLQYQRNDAQLSRARFRVRGDTLELQPAHEDFIVRVGFFGDEIERITEFDPLTGELLAERSELNVYPASHYVTPREKLEKALVSIEEEMDQRVGELEAEGRVLEGARLRQRTMFDLEMLRELGFCSGVENYSRHLAGREAGSRPWTLLDYFPPDWLLVVDESHMTIPQVVGMYKNDRTRKEILVDFGFRLPSALDNRPLTFEEFQDHLNQVIYMSATPGPYELEKAKGRVVEQLIRPTGVVDPTIEVKPTEGQIDDLLEQLRVRVERGERAIVTTLTKRMAEDLADYLRELGVKVQYLHSEVDTLERVQILRDLRLGVYDVLVGINLLREGIDLPEVTLVAILDADKEGFLRSAWSLIQVTGRAARHVGGHVIMYADRITESMRAAIDETDRRRAVQEAYNLERGIEPRSIVKEIHDLNDRLHAVAEASGEYAGGRELDAMSEAQVEQLVAQLTAEMRTAAGRLEFERAAALRDEIQAIRLRVLGEDASVEVGRAAERAAREAGRPGSKRDAGTRRGPRAGRRAPAGAEAPIAEVTSVTVVEAGEEPADGRATDEGTASDWLPGIRDEHEDEGGWQAAWLDRPTWDHRVTPHVVRRTGKRPPRAVRRPR